MRTIRKKGHEKLDDANLQRVLDYLNADQPITKKEACAMLNITYNTTRLNSIMIDFEDTLRHRAKRKAQKNNTRDSNVVPHRSTNLARSCLTSLSEREAVLS